MWQQWLLKSRQGSEESTDDGIRGPAHPAAVAAAAKIAFSALGRNTDALFQTETHEKPLSERPPVDPAAVALLERTDSGTLKVPIFSVASEVNINDFVDGEIKVAELVNSTPAPSLPTIRSPFEKPERRNRNSQWLRLHFRSLSDIGGLPFQNADLWQLHQYYFSPPTISSDDDSSAGKESTDTGADPVPEAATMLAPEPISSQPQLRSVPGAVSFQELHNALSSSSDAFAQSHRGKRPSSTADVEDLDGTRLAKKPKSLKPRIAYYPRIMVSCLAENISAVALQIIS
jgi:hypothetical protein